MADESSTDLDQLVSTYRRERPQYEAFTHSLDALLRTLLVHDKLEYFSVELRTKTVESFDDKVHREDKAGKYSKPSDITDLTGIRIINYLQEECDAVEDLLSKNFIVDTKNSVRKDDELDPDKFGYLSTHYVISLSDERSNLPEFQTFKGLKAEIQIRTLLQHTWAAIDWKFRYKSEKEAPRDLRRRLFRISALLEAADNEFSAVNEKIKELREEYSRNITIGDLRISVNTEAIRSFLAESPTVTAIMDVALEAGIEIPSYAQPSDSTAESVRRLHITSLVMDLYDLEAINDALKRVLPQAKALFTTMAASITGHGSSIRFEPAAVVRYALLLHAGRKVRGEVLRQFNSVPAIVEAFAKVQLPQSRSRAKKSA